MMDDDIKQDGEIILSDEKREYPRVPMNLKVKYKVLEADEAAKALQRHFDPDAQLSANDTRDGETVDVSRSGILMNTNEELRVKSYITVLMFITVPGITANCKALAEVMRRDSNPETELYAYRVGLKFHKILHHNLKNYKFLDLNGLLKIKESF